MQPRLEPVSTQPTKCSVPVVWITPLGVIVTSLNVSVYQHPIRLPAIPLLSTGAWPVAGSTDAHGSPGAPADISNGPWMPDTCTVGPCASATPAQTSTESSVIGVISLFM